jgi:phospholipase/carboxylesterase
LLHGFGAPGDDLVDLGRYLEVPPGSSFVFPAAPLELPGYGDSRAWWMIDMRSFDGPKDRTEEVPEGLMPARALVTALLEKLIAEGAGPIVLGGFSQGAMLSLDTALHLSDKTAAHLAGLLLMSGTPINGREWTPRLEQLRDLPVLMSHGKRDPILSFAASQGLRDRLKSAGAAVEWVEFDGGHEIPPPVLGGAVKVLRAAATRAAAAKAGPSSTPAAP